LLVLATVITAVRIRMDSSFGTDEICLEATVCCVMLTFTLLTTETFASNSFHAISGSFITNVGTGQQELAFNTYGSHQFSDNSGGNSSGGSVTLAVPLANLFQFDAFASSTSTTGSSEVSGLTTFVQPFTIARNMRVSLTGNVVRAPGDPTAVSSIVVNGGNGNLDLSLHDDTSGGTETISLVFEPWVDDPLDPLDIPHQISGLIITSANVEGTHGGSIDGSLIVTLPADLNNDMAVNSSDQLVWEQGYGTFPGTFLDGDVNGDSRNACTDFLDFQRDFGLPVQSASFVTFAATVPSPTSLWLAGAGLFLVAAKRRR